MINAFSDYLRRPIQILTLTKESKFVQLKTKQETGEPIAFHRSSGERIRAKNDLKQDKLQGGGAAAAAQQICMCLPV